MPLKATPERSRIPWLRNVERPAVSDVATVFRSTMPPHAKVIRTHTHVCTWFAMRLTWSNKAEHEAAVLTGTVLPRDRFSAKENPDPARPFLVAGGIRVASSGTTSDVVQSWADSRAWQLATCPDTRNQEWPHGLKTLGSFSIPLVSCHVSLYYFVFLPRVLKPFATSPTCSSSQTTTFSISGTLYFFSVWCRFAFHGAGRRLSSHYNRLVKRLSDGRLWFSILCLNSFISLTFFFSYSLTYGKVSPTPTTVPILTLLFVL